jgi:hypothetical protein
LGHILENNIWNNFTFARIICVRKVAIRANTIILHYLSILSSITAQTEFGKIFAGFTIALHLLHFGKFTSK